MFFNRRSVQADTSHAAPVAPVKSAWEVERLKQACDFFRHYSTVQFTMFSVFMIVTAAIANVLFGRDVRLQPHDAAGLRIAGVVVAVVFGSYQSRIAWLRAHYKKLISQLDFELGGGSNSPRLWVFIVLGGMLILHAGSIVLWLLA